MATLKPIVPSVQYRQKRAMQERPTSPASFSHPNTKQRRANPMSLCLSNKIEIHIMDLQQSCHYKFDKIDTCGHTSHMCSN